MEPPHPVCCCCSPVHRPPAHRFFHGSDGWLMKGRAFRGFRSCSRFSSQWLMDATLIRSDPSTSANATCWRDSVAAVMNFSGIETQPFCKIFFWEQSSYQSTKFLPRLGRFKLTCTKYWEAQKILVSCPNTTNGESRDFKRVALSKYSSF